MNRLVLGLVIVAACVLGATTYLQSLRAQTQEQQAAQEARERVEAAAQQAQEEAKKAQQRAEVAQLEAARQLEQAKKARIAVNAVASEFATPTIDIGTVVADIEKSVKFYTEAIGFKELPGFDVSGDFAKDVGLTNGASLKIHRLALGEGAGATTLKLMELSKQKPKKNDNEFIHSELGFRYLTIVVTDTNAALKRLEKAGVKPIAKTPQAIPESIAKGMWLTIVRDPDGNFVELVGPKK